jgi:hypothetical protein
MLWKKSKEIEEVIGSMLEKAIGKINCSSGK